MNWDLDKFAFTMLIKIEEVDNSETITTRETSSTEFAANFGVDGNAWKKLGLKFGISGKKQFISERIVVTTVGNDDLGPTTVEFGEKVIIGETTLPGIGLVNPTTFFYTREYSTGLVSFSLEPVRVQ